MKKFKYRIESYLKYVKHLRDQALHSLKKADAVRQAHYSTYRKLQDRKKQAFVESSQIGNDPKDLHFVRDNNRFIESLKAQLKEVQKKIEEAENIYQEKHKVLVIKQQELRKLEAHREQAKENFKKEYKKRQVKIFDEINSTRYRGKNAKPV